MRASGQDKRGQGSAKASIVSTMHEDEGVTTVDVETDFTITGRLARFGRGGMIQDISNRLFREFSECLQARIEAPPVAEPTLLDTVMAATPEGAASMPPARSDTTGAAKPIGGFSLFFRALLDRLGRLFRRS